MTASRLEARDLGILLVEDDPINRRVALRHFQ
ncbi:MAG: hypothetical protein ACI9WU_000484 [Myxococcota bacterium]